MAAATQPPAGEGHGKKNNEEFLPGAGGLFRGVAAAFRSSMPAIRTVGQARPLAFASEGAVAGKNIMPKYAYYSAWGLSGVSLRLPFFTELF